MHVQVNELGSFFDASESRLFHSCRLPHEGQYRAIVVQVRMLIKELHALD